MIKKEKSYNHLNRCRKHLTKFNINSLFFKKMPLALASVAQLVGTLSCNGEAVGLIPGHGTHLDCGFDPQSGYTQSLIWGWMGGNQSMLLSDISVSLCPFLFL